MRAIDLSHTVEPGMVTYPGLPGPVVSDFWSREASRAHYAEGTEFHIARIDMVANTGTYLDTPYHRYADGHDLDGLRLEQVADVPGVVVDGRATGATDVDTLDGVAVTGRAVLIRTGWDRHWRSDRYADRDHPFITAELANALVQRRAAVVGIDSINIDDTSRGERPAHSILLRAAVPIVEHLTNLGALRGDFRFFAVPVRFAGVGTFPVRAFALRH